MERHRKHAAWLKACSWRGFFLGQTSLSEDMGIAKSISFLQPKQVPTSNISVRSPGHRRHGQQIQAWALEYRLSQVQSLGTWMLHCYTTSWPWMPQHVDMSIILFIYLILFACLSLRKVSLCGQIYCSPELIALAAKIWARAPKHQQMLRPNWAQGCRPAEILGCKN